jgi:hypothetical protein
MSRSSTERSSSAGTGFADELQHSSPLLVEETKERAQVAGAVTTGGFALTEDQTAQLISSRLAGRMNAAAISEEEVHELLAERKRLLDKKFAGTMTRMESHRLEFVRWSLDRIDDARHGPGLDRLEAFVRRYEILRDELAELRTDLDAGRVKKRQSASDRDGRDLEAADRKE